MSKKSYLSIKIIRLGNLYSEVTMMQFIDIRDLISAFNKKVILSSLIRVVQLVLVQIIQVIWQ